MQKDSVHMSTSGSMTQNPAVTQESVLKCLQCSLVFKSKVFLFEHLNKVHGLDVDVALTNAGLSHSETYETLTDNSSKDAGDHFECQHCDFRALSRDVLNGHEEQCEREFGMENGVQNQVNSGSQKTRIIIVRKKEAEGEKQTSSVNPAKSTSNAKCTTSPSKDLKTYKRPLQTISKYFVASTGVKRKPPVLSGNCTLSLDGTKETLFLQESPSNSNLNSSGVFKVTAVPTIDITKTESTRFLMMDPFPDPDPKPAKPQGQLKETHLNTADKRPSGERSGGPPVKKAKSDKEKNRPKSESEIKEQSSSHTEFSFEFSEDEEERNLDDTDARKDYICKHCDFSAVGIRAVSTHYQNSHPHVRYNAVYLQDPSDQSATFRCLKCPTEFSHVVELKKHQTENHPEMPNLLAVQSHDLSLAFKCFVCPFTTNASKALKEHYKKKHPTHTVDNPLMYYRYLTSGRQERDESQANECKKCPSPERSREISPERASAASREATKTSSPQHPTSSGADVALYQCNNCKFSHKSVIVMHVHYQKSHPDEAVSIDTIKQLARVSSLAHSQMVPDMSPKSVVEKSLPTESDSDAHKSTSKDKLSKKRIKLVLRKPVRNPEVLKSRSEPAVKVDSEEDRSARKTTPTKQNIEISPDTVGLSSSSPKELFYCKVCSYSSTNVTSVVGHHNTKHYEHERTDAEEITSYSVEMQKKKLGPHESPSTTPSDSRASKRVDVRSVNKSQHEKESNPYACPENLFYCQKCNFANPSVKGVLNHQAKIHTNLKIERECVLKHTSLICVQIAKSKSQDSTSQLPLPMMSEGMENPFFCHLCNFRSVSMDGVQKHYCNRHPTCRAKKEQILSYSSMILEKIGKSDVKTPADQEVKRLSLWGKGTEKKKKKQPSRVSDPSAASQTQRTLKCHKCQYNTQHVYLLKRHLWKVHKMHHTVTEVLKMCYKRGSVQAGYHCEMCVFSHKTADAVFDHYREKHPKQPSLEYIITRLYIGPDSIKIKSKKLQTKESDSLTDVDVTDDSLPSQSSGHNDTKTFSCKACSFKSDSAINMTHHYRAVHPWSVKEDGSVLDVIHNRKPGASRQLEDQSDLFVTFEAYQEPLEFDNSFDSPDKETKSSKKFKCQLCPMRFYTQRHLRAHHNLIHHQDSNEERSVHVFKCPHCTYVNTNHHGLLTHCQMMHPGLESSANSLLIDGDHLNNMKGCLKRRGQVLRLSGYMCETCPQIYATQEKLKKHCRKKHNEAFANSVPTMLKPSILKSTQVKIRSNHGFLLKSSLLRRTRYAMVKCQHCAFKSTTKIGLGRHMLLHHSDASVPKDGDPPYKCALCSNSYYRKKRLGNHYITKHGKESFIKYFLPLKKQLEKKPWSTYQDAPSAQHGGNHLGESISNTTTGQNKVLVFTCPNCTYVNATFHGILTHCQMRHPDFTARADELKSVEILTSDMISSSKGESLVARGFRCKKCPQIHVSMKKLKLHLERNHGQSEAANPKLILKIKTTKKQPDCEFQHSVLEAFALKNDSETDLSPQLETPQVNQTNTTLRNKEKLYKCHICPYTAFYRRYLQSHYRKYHKIDVLTTFKLLQKYNKRKPSMESPCKEAQPEESAAVKCKLCPDSAFRSSELLLDHFRTVHNSDQILDFTILSRGSKRTTGLYKCSHCSKQLNGIKKMCYHLDRHRETMGMSGKTEDAKDPKTITSDVIMTPEEKPAEPAELPAPKPVEDIPSWNVTPVKTPSLPTSPAPSPTKPTDQEQPEEDSLDDIPTCKHCGRTFMSLKGLRSHERSHEALAAIKKHTLPSSVLKNKINRYIIYKPGTTKPFVCSFCSYRTNVMVLWRRHFMKNHQDVIADPDENEDQDEEGAQSDTEPQNSSGEWSSFPELHEKSQKNKRSQYSEPPDVQRQLNQYSMIAQAGASSQAAVGENMMLESSVLYCDLCSFNTEHLSSIRRHYVNRHGKKMLKCKDCSFFTGSRKTLETHMEMGHSSCQSEPTHQKDLCCPFCLYQTKNKNSMIDHIILHREERLVPIEVRRPKLSRYLQGIVFRCHNCTFTCGNAESLHLHMMKHDDIKPYKCQLCFFDCTRLSDLEEHLSGKHQVVRNHELVGQVSLDQLEARVDRMPGYVEEPPSDSEHLNSDRAIVKTEEMVTDCDEIPEETRAEHPEENAIMEKITLKMEEDTDGSSFSDLQNENAKLTTLVQEKHELDQQEQAVTEGTDDTVDPSVCEGKDCNSSETERQTNEKVAQILRSEASIPEVHKKVDQDGEVERMEDGESSTTSAENQKNLVYTKEKKSLENSIKTQFNKYLSTLGPNCAKLIESHEEGSSVSLKEDPVGEQKNCEIRDPYGEMPVLENEYFKKEIDSPGCCEEEDPGDHPEQSPEDGCTDQGHDEADGIKDAVKPHVSKGAPEVTDSGNEKHCLPYTEDKQLTCELCGRNFLNSSDLQHHFVRHRL